MFPSILPIDVALNLFWQGVAHQALTLRYKNLLNNVSVIVSAKYDVSMVVIAEGPEHQSAQSSCGAIHKMIGS